MRAADIFRKVKTTVSGQTTVLRFVDTAAYRAGDYGAIFTEHPKWNDYGTATRQNILTINRDLRVKHIRFLMLAVAQHFGVKATVSAERSGSNSTGRCRSRSQRIVP